jgi:hypothetical protein
MEIAGVPKAVHGAFILGSPVDARPSGAGPVAAGDRITGVFLYISATRGLHSAIYRLASSYCSTDILRLSKMVTERTISLRTSSWFSYRTTACDWPFRAQICFAVGDHLLSALAPVRLRICVTAFLILNSRVTNYWGERFARPEWRRGLSDSEDVRTHADELADE